jgi:hypothetical protein
MKKIIFILIIAVVCLPLLADKYAGEIFRMGAGVRNYALGNLGATDTKTTAIAYWNSALLQENQQTSFEIMHAEEYSGLLTYDTIAGVIGNKKNIAFVVTRIGIDDIPLTKWDEVSQRPYQYKSVNNSDFIAYVGFRRNIGRFPLGFTPKIAYRTLAEKSGFGFGADISTFWQATEKIALAVKVRDFFSTQILWENGTHEIVNPSVDLEGNFHFQMPVLKKHAVFYFAADIYTEGRDYASTISFSPVSLDFHTGMELIWNENLDLLFGYDVEHFTTGLSLHLAQWNLSYAFKQHAALENSHRISIGYRL